MNAWSGSTIPIPADCAEAREDCGPRVRKAMEQFPSYSGEMPPQEARRAGKSVCGAKWAKWGDLGFDHETWNPKKLYKQMPVFKKHELNLWTFGRKAIGSTHYLNHFAVIIFRETWGFGQHGQLHVGFSRENQGIINVGFPQEADVHTYNGQEQSKKHRSSSLACYNPEE